MAFPTTLIVVMIVSVVSVGSTLASAQVLLSGSLYCTNLDGSTTALPAGTTVDIVTDFFDDFVQLHLAARDIANEGLFVYPFIGRADPESFHLEVDLPTNSCNYNPPARTLRYPILAAKLNGVVVGYVPGPPTLIRA